MFAINILHIEGQNLDLPYKIAKISVVYRDTTNGGDKELYRIGNVYGKIAMLDIHFPTHIGNYDYYLYDESTSCYFIDTVKIDQKRNKIFDILRLNDMILYNGYYFVSKQYQDLSLWDMVRKAPDQFVYQDFWIQLNNGSFFLEKVSSDFIYKKISTNFSYDGRYLIFATYNRNNLNYSFDDSLYYYEIEDIRRGNVNKVVLDCKRCPEAFIVNDTIIFCKELEMEGEIDDVYYNIYKAPLSNIHDTTLIAHRISLQSISPDGKYILGKKYLYGNSYTNVIIDVATKRFQYILGRNDLYGGFYSLQKEKFAFNFDDYIVYIEYPETYPFDALKYYEVDYDKKKSEAFWKKYTIENPEEENN